MLRLHPRKLCLVGCLALGMTGCASRGINRRNVEMPPPGVEKTVSTEHLIRVANILERQNQTARAQELYRQILDRDPNHTIARSRLQTPPDANNAIVPPSPSPQFQKSQPPGQHVEFKRKPGSQTVGIASTAAGNEPNVLPEFAKEALPFPGAATKTQGGAKPAELKTTANQVPSIDKAVTDPNERRFNASSKLRTTEVNKPVTTSPAEATAKPGTSSELPAIPSANVKTVSKPAAQATGLRIMPRPKHRKTPAPTILAAAKSQEVTKKQIAGMIAGLGAKRTDTRAVAAFTLGRLGVRVSEAVPQLQRALLTEKSGPVRVRIAEAIARIQPSNQPAYALVAEALIADDFKTRWEAVCAADVLNLGTEDNRREGVQRLADLLADLNPTLRAMATLQLAEFGDAAEPAIDTLMKAKREGDPGLQKAAAATLAVLRPAAIAVPAPAPEKTANVETKTNTKVK